MQYSLHRAALASNDTTYIRSWHKDWHMSDPFNINEKMWGLQTAYSSQCACAALARPQVLPSAARACARPTGTPARARGEGAGRPRSALAP